jgi:hypothetical protein
VTLLIRESERFEQRVLGALRCLDATTGTAIARPLHVHVATAAGEAADLLRNRSGLYVVAKAPGLEAHSSAFTQPPGDAPHSYVATVSDPDGHYLPRKANLTLPRDHDPDHAADADSLFRPIDIPLYPSSSATTVRPLYRMVPP